MDKIVSPQLWRLHTRPEHDEHVDPTHFCIENNVVGVGWPVDSPAEIRDWDTYEKLVKKQAPDWLEDNRFMPAMNALIDNMQIGDLIWTRSRDGIYFLGKCTGDWKHTVKRRFKNADTVNIRGCRWNKIGVVSEVPGKVVNSFIPSRTLQRVYDDSALGYSQLLLGDKVTVGIDDIFSLLSSEDLEDVIGLYLQQQMGYHFVPSSRSRRDDTIKYEYIMMDNKGTDIAVQVKAGNESLDTNDYLALAKTAKVFLFCSSGTYTGPKNPRITRLDPLEIRTFLTSVPSILTARVRRWMQYLDSNRDKKQRVTVPSATRIQKAINPVAQ